MAPPQKPLTTQQKIVTFAQGQIGTTVGGGECTDLVEAALRSAGAKALHDLGQTDQQVGKKDHAYVWGDAIALKDALPGDILQFTDHNVKIDVTVTWTFKDGTVVDNAEGSDVANTPRRHHTALIEVGMAGDGSVKTLEQNVDPGGRVTQRLRLLTQDSVTEKTETKTVEHPVSKKKDIATVKTVVKITVTGTIQAYRAQMK